jgi:DNA-binding NtrC family response regulator
MRRLTAVMRDAGGPRDASGRFSALVVDDDAGFRESLALLVARAGCDVREASTLAEARARLAEAAVDVILVDLGLTDGSGIELLRDERIAAESELIVITGNATVHSAVQALREGALDYLTKPLDHARLGSTLTAVFRTRGYKAEVRSLRDELRELGRFGRLVGRSSAMQQVYDLIARVAPTQASVLLAGESGTGKELAAETIHLLSRRREGPFLAVNSGAIAKTLIESELFGHEKGSFTGADSGRTGYFEQSGGGTLFLDEISDMAPELQGRLLRVLETGKILRVGGSEAVAVDVRVIAATNRDPARLVQEGVLRGDLFYRLNVFPISLPPLRERGGDVELLANHFLGAVNAREGSEKQWSSEARARLEAYHWPGNVRELKNAVERAAIMADSAIGAELLPGNVTAGRGPSAEGGAVPGNGSSEAAGSSAGAGSAPGAGGELLVRVGSTLAEVERRLILATLDEFQGDKRRTAQALGIGLKTLYTHLSVYRAAGHAAGVDARPAAPDGLDTGGAPFVESTLPNSPIGASPVETEPAKS